MADLILPPGLILILAGLLLPLIPRTVGNLLLLAAPLGALALVWSVPDGVSLTAPFLGLTLEFVQADDLARLFGTVFCIAAFGGGLYAMTQHSTRELACAFIYAGSALGVVFAGDLVTVFIFWEIMAVTSTVIVWCGGASARNAGLRYAAIHFLGGVLLMAGIAGELAINGSTDFAAMDLSNAARWMIFAGFLINAGAPPFSPWVPDAYPAASWSGAVFLSAFTTKTAVYVLIRGFPGTEILIFIGLFMIFYGIIYAILENDMRRVLVYSIVNQIGFMLVAIGIGTELALNGAAAHAFTHIIYKATLLMSAGAVMQAVGTSKMSELGGLYKSMPLTAICGLVGAMAISALPFTSGYVSKSLLTGAASEAHHALAWYGLTAASAAAFLYVGLRYPWFTFFDGSKADKSGQDPHITMKLAMVSVCLPLRYLRPCAGSAVRHVARSGHLQTLRSRKDRPAAAIAAVCRVFFLRHIGDASAHSNNDTRYRLALEASGLEFYPGARSDRTGHMAERSRYLGQPHRPDHRTCVCLPWACWSAGTNLADRFDDLLDDRFARRRPDPCLHLTPFWLNLPQ
jgi:multicomponent Na+:H+ antiporter subunit D